MNEDMSDLPQAIAADPDGVQVALRAAHTLWSRGDTAESLKWLRKAAESASDEGADLRSLQLAKAAAELRAKLFRASEPPPSPAGGQGAGSFPPSGAAPGESGSHPIAQPRPEAEPAREASLSSAPPIEAFSVGAGVEESPSGSPSRPVTATQYPSHRPRQRMGLLSASPGSVRDGTAYAAVPSWSADSERRPSSAPPPLPRASLDDYEELEAEPDEEAADDPASVWSSDGPEPWRPSDVSSAVLTSAGPGVIPPPLPQRGAFADDDTEFTQQTVALPAAEEGASEPFSTRESQRAAAFGVNGSAWDEQARTPSWNQDPGSSSWAAELHRSTWGNASDAPGAGNHAASNGIGGNSVAGSAVSGSAVGNGIGLGGGDGLERAETALQSETARAKLTARVHHQAVRVSFTPDLRVPGQYVVRPLREGEKAATGERIALLVALEPGVPLV